MPLLSSDVIHTLQQWLSVARLAPRNLPSEHDFGEEPGDCCTIYLNQREVSLEVVVLFGDTVVQSMFCPFRKDLVMLRRFTHFGLFYSVETRYTWCDPPDLDEGWSCLVVLPGGARRRASDRHFITETSKTVCL